MRIIKPSHEIIAMADPDFIMEITEKAGRTCYKSENKITPDSAAGFIKGIIKSGHLSITEHMNITVKFICDRGVSHELVRHRIAAYSQESTRYCNYSKGKFGNEITVIRPFFWKEETPEYERWLSAMLTCEHQYLSLIEHGAKPEEARSVLPNSLKTEIVMTANLREWRHVLNLRCSKPAHPQIRELMLPLLEELNDELPVVFSDIYEKYFKHKEDV